MKLYIYSIALVLILGCKKEDESINESNGPVSHNVEYRVTGTAPTIDVTLSNATGGTEQYSDRGLPYSYSFMGVSGKFIYISAQNNGQTGSVTSAIYINGNLYKTATSSGAYVIATSSGSIP